MELIRSALTSYLNTRHPELVGALAIALLAVDGKRALGEDEVVAATKDAEEMLSRIAYDIQDAVSPHVADDDLYADLTFTREGKSIRLMFAYDSEDKTWDMYPSTGDTPSRQRAQDAYRKFHQAH